VACGDGQLSLAILSSRHLKEIIKKLLKFVMLWPTVIGMLYAEIYAKFVILWPTVRGMLDAEIYVESIARRGVSVTHEY
jgi:hypothetical protein